MTELFPVEAVTQDSPKLSFLKRYNLTTYRAITGRWYCSLDEDTQESGATEEEAVLAFCETFKLPHWSVQKP